MQCAADSCKLSQCLELLQDNISRLESVNIKLRKEKVDLVKEISTIKQEAHQDILRAEAALNHKIRCLEVQAKELNEQLETTHRTLEEASSELSTAQETMKQDAGTIAQVLYTLTNVNAVLLVLGQSVDSCCLPEWTPNLWRVMRYAVCSWKPRTSSSSMIWKI